MASAGFTLDLEPRKKNVFVTQLGEPRAEDDGETITKYPVVKEAADKLIETGLNTLQKTLVLKREVEVEEVQVELNIKKEEYEERMARCNKRRQIVVAKQNDFKDRVFKFDKFIKECEAKRFRAIQKYQIIEGDFHCQQVRATRVKQSDHFNHHNMTKLVRKVSAAKKVERKHNDALNSETQVLSAALSELKSRHDRLQNFLGMHRIFNEFMIKAQESLPENYLGVLNVENMNLVIMMRHQTLNSTHINLVNQMTKLVDQLKKLQNDLDEMVYHHNQKKLVINRELAELQLKQERFVAKTKELEEAMISNKGTLRDKSADLGSILLAILNIAEQCHKRHDKPVDILTLDERLKRIESYVVDKGEVETLAMELMESDNSPRVTTSKSRTGRQSSISGLSRRRKSGVK